METLSVSQHDKRKNEIIDCAAALFFRGSYEKTSVQKIIDTLGIAKGTFYHYFDSKFDLLNQFTLRESRKILKQLNSIVERTDIDIVDKFNSYFDIAVNWKMENWELLLIYIKSSSIEENRIVYQALLESNIKIAKPSILLMINEGIEKGFFKTDFPDLAAEAIFRFGGAVTDLLRPLILESRTGEEGFRDFLRIMDFYQDTVEKILGAEKGLFKIFDREKISGIYSRSSETKGDSQ